MVLCVVCVPDFRGSKIWLLPGLSLDPLSAGPPNFSLFFALPPPFSLFSSLSGCLLVEFWWCLRSDRTLKCARQPENSKRAHFRTPALQTPPKFHEKTPKREERKKIVAGGGKKREILASTLRGPTLRGPIFSGFGASPLGAAPSGPPQMSSLPRPSSQNHNIITIVINYSFGENDHHNCECKHDLNQDL